MKKSFFWKSGSSSPVLWYWYDIYERVVSRKLLLLVKQINARYLVCETHLGHDWMLYRSLLSTNNLHGSVKSISLGVWLRTNVMQKCVKMQTAFLVELTLKSLNSCTRVNDILHYSSCNKVLTKYSWPLHPKKSFCLQWPIKILDANWLSLLV